MPANKSIKTWILWFNNWSIKANYDERKQFFSLLDSHCCFITISTSMYTFPSTLLNNTSNLHILVANGVASRRKLKVWVHLRLRLARPCVHLRWITMTCGHAGRDQFCTQVDASFSPFGHSTQVSASWEMSINLLLANEIQDISDLKWFL